MKGLIEGKSDPYAIVRVGTQTFCSRVIDEELNPKWGETYEVGELRSGTMGRPQEVVRENADWMILTAAAHEPLIPLCSPGDRT